MDEFAARDIRLLVLTMVEGLVDDRARVDVMSRNPQPDRLVLTVGVAIRDQGKVIGKNGRTVRAMRCILEAIGKREGIRTELVILEKEKGTA